MTSNSPKGRNSRPYDLILFGATGFTGRQSYKYLASEAPDGLRWAIAGRNRERLQDLLDTSPTGVSKPDLVVADYDDLQSITKMIESTAALVNLAGPYAQHGEFIFSQCIRCGTDYVDIGGETFFLQEMIRTHHDAARSNGVKLIPVAGYESLPFDLLTLLAVNRFRDRYKETCAAAKIITSFSRSAPIIDNRISGGSLGTMKSILAEDSVNAYNDASCLLPDDAPRISVRKRNKVVYQARFDPDVDEIIAPLFPAPFLNVPVILRSAHLLREHGSAYAPDFTYADAMTLDFFADTPEGKMKEAKKIAARYRMTARAMAGPALIRGLVNRRLDKIKTKPGDGPSDEALECVDYKLQLFATSNTGRKIKAVLTAEGHPGYLSTARIAIEAGMALCLERDSLTPHAGILTPASGLGLGILHRLERAGIRMWIDDEGP